jgi:diacylglycerol O-acyltransferase
LTEGEKDLPDQKALSPLDSLFLWGEHRNTMMHVGGLLTFSPPADAGPYYLRDLVDEAIALHDIKAPWNRKLLATGVLPNPFRSWVTDDDIDLEYHVRRSALPSPGGERELGVLVSRLHSNPLDMRRPPWECHFIEGLEGGRFALYVKMHHSLIDGFSAMKLLVRSFSTDAAEMDKPMFFSIGFSPRGAAAGSEDAGVLAEVGQLVSSARAHTASALTLGKRVTSPLVPFRKRQASLVSASKAPRSILNNRIGPTRRFATQQYALADMKELGERHDATLNDVFLAIVGGGLRKFLGEMGELPDKSLVAFMPVNVRTQDDNGGGNAIGALLANVGSNVADPLERLHLVSESASAAKAQLEGMTKQGILAYSAYLMAPAGIQAFSAITGIRGALPTNFNLCVSNVPGPDYPLYLRGSRVIASYPVSIPFHSMALNITLQSYDGTLGVGFVGCRDTLPHLQRLAVYTGESLEELAAAG